METVLSTSKLTKNFRKLCAVNQLDLEVKRGQVFGMLGPNGSGKTTTLGMLMGVVNPSSGSFSWFGEPATHHTRKKIGAVLEHPIFYPYLSGQKNLELNAMIKGADPANISTINSSPASILEGILILKLFSWGLEIEVLVTVNRL